MSIVRQPRLLRGCRALTAPIVLPLVFVMTSAPPVGGPSAMADVITLTNGDVINAEIVEELDDRIVIEHEALGRMEILRERIASISSGVEEEKETAEEAAPAEEPSAPPPAAEPPPRWKSSFTFGGTASFGNTDSQNLNTAIHSTLDQGDEITKIDLNYYLDLSDGDKVDNRFTAGVRHDWLMPDSPWLYFVQGRYDYDQFQAWEHRLSGHGGVGYQLIDEQDMKLSLRAGLGFSKEWKSPDQPLRPEALFGVNWDWQVSENQSINVESTIFPDLDDTGEFRTITTANWSALLDAEANMSLTAGVFHEYQSDVPSNKDKNDVRITIGLKFDF